MCHIVSIKKIGLCVVSVSLEDSKVPLLSMCVASDGCRDCLGRNRLILHLDNSKLFHHIQSLTTIKPTSKSELPSSS